MNVAHSKLSGRCLLLETVVQGVCEDLFVSILLARSHQEIVLAWRA